MDSKSAIHLFGVAEIFYIKNGVERLLTQIVTLTYLFIHLFISGSLIIANGTSSSTTSNK
jgi:hypothetical protein